MSKKIIGATVATPINPEKFGKVEASATVSSIDFSNFDNGSFTETVDGEVITHTVEFDESGRPVKIDNTSIMWGDS